MLVPCLVVTDFRGLRVQSLKKGFHYGSPTVLASFNLAGPDGGLVMAKMSAHLPPVPHDAPVKRRDRHMGSGKHWGKSLRMRKGRQRPPRDCWFGFTDVVAPGVITRDGTNALSRAGDGDTTGNL